MMPLDCLIRQKHVILLTWVGGLRDYIQSGPYTLSIQPVRDQVGKTPGKASMGTTTRLFRFGKRKQCKSWLIPDRGNEAPFFHLRSLFSR